MTFETARDIARISHTMAEEPAGDPGGQRLGRHGARWRRGAIPEVAVQIMHEVPGVTPIESPNMFQAYRQQMTGLRIAVLAAMGCRAGAV